MIYKVQNETRTHPALPSGQMNIFLAGTLTLWLTECALKPVGNVSTTCDNRSNTCRRSE